MANEITSIKIGNTEYPIDFSNHGHDASKITGLHKVATSGSYTDLSSKPTIPPDLSDELDDLGEAFIGVREQVDANTNVLSGLLDKPGLNATGTVTKITPGVGLTGTSKDEPITGSGTINLKTASTTEIGGIKIGYTESGKNYPVELNSSNQAYVNVPWEDHPTDGANATKGPTADVTGTNGATIKVPKITVDSLGHVTTLTEYTYTSKNTTYSAMTGATASAAGTEGLVPAPAKGEQGLFLRGDGKWATIEIPLTLDTKNTAGATNTSSKIFLIGATSQAAEPQTYSHDTVFVDTNGNLNSNNAIVGGTLSTYPNYISYGTAESTYSTLTNYTGSYMTISAAIGNGGMSGYVHLFGVDASDNTKVVNRVPINGTTRYVSYSVPAGKKITITFQLSSYQQMRVGSTNIYSCTVPSLYSVFYGGIFSNSTPTSTSTLLSSPSSFNIPVYTSTQTSHTSSTTATWINTGTSARKVYAVVYYTYNSMPFYNIKTSSSGSKYTSGTVYMYPSAKITSASIKTVATGAKLLNSGAVYSSNGFFIGNGSGESGNMIYSYPGVFIVKSNQRILEITSYNARTSSNGGQSWSNI